MKILNPTEIEKQESLTLEFLNKISKPKLQKTDLISPRPQSSFIELVNWVQQNFGKEIDDESSINKFIHNRIIIDGQFTTFCEENKIKITQLLNDAIISWETDKGFERFFLQGIFLIEGKDFKFLHCALFHKGNHNEDEVAFFNLVSNFNYNQYISLRNKFDAWVKTREHSNMCVRVIDGEDIAYEQDSNWENLFLPDDIKNEIRSLVENFLSSKEKFLSRKIPWKKGIILFGPPGNGKTSIIRTIISMYNFKPVTISNTISDSTLQEAFSYAEEHSPSLLYFEDLDSRLADGKIDLSSFLNYLDGIAAKNGLLIVATANNLNKLPNSITDRPVRFDRKYNIPLPDEKMSFRYIKSCFGKSLSDEQIKKISTLTVKNKFSYAYLKDLYVSLMYETLNSKEEKVSLKQVESTLKRLIKDKQISNKSDFNTARYF